MLGNTANRIDILIVPGFGQGFQQWIDRHGCNPVEIGKIMQCVRVSRFPTSETYWSFRFSRRSLRIAKTAASYSLPCGTSGLAVGFRSRSGRRTSRPRIWRATPRLPSSWRENELPYRGIEVSGKATVEALPDLMPLVRRLAQRYMVKEAGLAYAETFADDALELIRLTPGTVRAWDFRDDHEETR